MARTYVAVRARARIAVRAHLARLVHGLPLPGEVERTMQSPQASPEDSARLSPEVAEACAAHAIQEVHARHIRRA